MDQLPILKTFRLQLRPFEVKDAHAVCQLAGNKEIAQGTINIPHPYEEKVAAEWINSLQKNLSEKNELTFAVTLQYYERLIGSMSLCVDTQHWHGHIGYWIGRPFWGKGYCTEAALTVMKYGFHNLGLNRIFAFYFPFNIASERVLKKLGMVHEGHLRKHYLHFGKFEDVEYCGILKEEFNKKYPPPVPPPTPEKPPTQPAPAEGDASKTEPA